jgi:hypothetical protein
MQKNEATKLAFLCIYLAELGFSNALQRIQTKNLISLPLASSAVQSGLERAFSPTRPWAGGSLESGHEETITQSFDFHKQLRRHSPWLG